MNDDRVQLNTVSAAQVLEHRLAILRPGQGIETVSYPDDNHPCSAHFAICQGDGVLAVASVIRESLPHDQLPDAWRLRGMGTYPQAQRLGYASRLVKACLAHVVRMKGELVWCTARTPILELYTRHGFSPQGREFNIPGAGRHYIMVKRIGKAT